MAEQEYDPKSILLTGGAGFIGSNTLCHLVLKYPDVQIVCLDKLNYCANTRNFEEIVDCPNYTFIKGDITSADLVNHVMKQYKIDTVMHFAAETHVDNSFGQSLAFTQSNVLGTHCLLEAAKACGSQIRRFIHVSTDEVYGHGSETGERSTVDDKLAPTNPYAASKAAAEFMVKSYATSFNMPTIITRGNNVYGPKQYPEKLIPKFISLLNNKMPCPLHGDGTNRRSFLYVQDVAEAFDCILKRGKVGAVYNIGSDYELQNKVVLDRLLELFGLTDDKDKYVRYVRDRAFNDFRYHIDTSSLVKLGWEQKVGFAEGLKMTKDWYLSRSEYWGDLSSALRAHPTTDPSISILGEEKQLTVPSSEKQVHTAEAVSMLRDAKRRKKST